MESGGISTLMALILPMDGKRLGGSGTFLIQMGEWFTIGKKYGSNWCLLRSANDGVMKTGWALTDNKWYYFYSSGAMKTGWINDNGKDYCLYSSGEMIANTVLYGYRFDSNGVATKLN